MAAVRMERAIAQHSHEIVNDVVLEIWHNPSLTFMKRVPEWALRAWMLNVLSRLGRFDQTLGYTRFIRWFPWPEAVETLRILMRKTMAATKGTAASDEDIRRFFNVYMIQLGEYLEPTSAGAGCAISPKVSDSPHPKIT